MPAVRGRSESGPTYDTVPWFVMVHQPGQATKLLRLDCIQSLGQELDRRPQNDLGADTVAERFP